jgi:hypothetical protein
MSRSAVQRQWPPSLYLARLGDDHASPSDPYSCSPSGASSPVRALEHPLSEIASDRPIL